MSSADFLSESEFTMRREGRLCEAVRTRWIAGNVLRSVGSTWAFGREGLRLRMLERSEELRHPDGAETARSVRSGGSISTRDGHPHETAFPLLNEAIAEPFDHNV